MADGAQANTMPRRRAASTASALSVQQFDTMDAICDKRPAGARISIAIRFTAGVPGASMHLHSIDGRHDLMHSPRQDDAGGGASGRRTLSLVERDPVPPVDKNSEVGGSNGLNQVNQINRADEADATVDTAPISGLTGAPDPDAALLAAVGARDPDAVRTLVARKLPRLLALATRLLGDRTEAEDVAQEVFMRTWKQAPHWQAGAARVDTWLHRVALNLCYDRLRGRKETSLEALNLSESAQQAQREAFEVGAGSDDTPEVRLETASRDAQVRAALAQLPPRQREAMVLHYYQEMSNIDAAALMGIGVDALESLLARARRNLRTRLSGQTSPHIDAASGLPPGRANEEA